MTMSAALELRRISEHSFLAAKVKRTRLRTSREPGGLLNRRRSHITRSWCWSGERTTDGGTGKGICKRRTLRVWIRQNSATEATAGGKGDLGRKKVPIYGITSLTRPALNNRGKRKHYSIVDCHTQAPSMIDTTHARKTHYEVGQGRPTLKVHRRADGRLTKTATPEPRRPGKGLDHLLSVRIWDPKRSPAVDSSEKAKGGPKAR